MIVKLKTSELAVMLVAIFVGTVVGVRVVESLVGVPHAKRPSVAKLRELQADFESIDSWPEAHDAAWYLQLVQHIGDSNRYAEDDTPEEWRDFRAQFVRTTSVSLQEFSGEDFGEDGDAWLTWIKEQRARPSGNIRREPGRPTIPNPK